MPTIWYRERRTNEQCRKVYNILRHELGLSVANAARLRYWSFGHIKAFVMANVKAYSDDYKLEVLEKIRKILEEGGDNDE